MVYIIPCLCETVKTYYTLYPVMNTYKSNLFLIDTMPLSGNGLLDLNKKLHKMS